MSTVEVLAAYPVARTHDIGQATEVLERVLPRIPLRMRVSVAQDTFAMHMNALDVGSITASYLRFGAEVHVVTSATEYYHVNIPLTGSTLFREGGMTVEATPQLAGVFGPGMAGDLVWRGGCAQVCLLLPRSSLDRELERHLGRAVAEPVLFEPAMDLSAATSTGWLDSLGLVLSYAERRGGRPLHPLTTQTLENLLVDSLLLTHQHNYTEALHGPAPAAGPRAVREAIELLRERPEHPWSVGELAAAVHLSVRALQEAFRRSTGLSPMRYLRQVRLARIHAELVAATPEEVTVTEVAARWGFLHHGHFAAAYRAEFGQSPATTLRT